MSQSSVRTPQRQKKRLWAKRGLKIGAGLLGLALLLVLSYLAALMIAMGPETAYRMIINGDSNINTFKFFPYRVVDRGGPVSILKKGSLANFPDRVPCVCGSLPWIKWCSNY